MVILQFLSIYLPIYFTVHFLSIPNICFDCPSHISSTICWPNFFHHLVMMSLLLLLMLNKIIEPPHEINIHYSFPNILCSISAVLLLLILSTILNLFRFHSSRQMLLMNLFDYQFNIKEVSSEDF